MSKPMTLKELGELLEHISTDHSFCKQKEGRFVKYVEPVIDTRTDECFAIKFRNSIDDTTLFHTQNDCRYLRASLFERCMKWLDKRDIDYQQPRSHNEN